MDAFPIINKTYEVYKTTTLLIAHAKKRWRYSLGASLEKELLDLLSELVKAKNAPKPLKYRHLLEASSLQEIILLKLRLFLELKICNETPIFQTQKNLMEIGRMLGGWMKAVQST